MPWWNDEEQRWTDEPYGSGERTPGFEPWRGPRATEHQAGPEPWERERFGEPLGGGTPDERESWTTDTYETGVRRRHARGPNFGRGPRRWKRSDEDILEDVCQRMADHGYLDPSEVTVEVTGGEVTLSGTVADRSQKRLAEAIADGVRGVGDVHNRWTIGAEREAERRQTRPSTSANR